MRVRTGDPAEAQTPVAVVREGDEPGVPGAKARRGHLAVADGGIHVGIGAGEPEDVRVAAAAVVERAKELATGSVGYDGPHADAFVEGAVLAAYEFTAFKSDPPEASEPHLIVRDGEQAAVIAECVNLARDLQNSPANVMTPSELARRAAAIEGVACEVWGREQIEAAGMGAFAAVARGSDEEPRLITLRYDGGEQGAPRLGLVGKEVTFDAGGISIKTANKMSEMKFDMSGGAAVIAATAAIARLGLPVNVVSVIGSCENLLDGRSMKPGDILRAKTGTTIEVINTDAEGRLVLADCLAHALDQGADRLIDIATLTGGIVTTFGTGHAGLMGTDDALCDAITEAGERTGE